MQEQKPNYIQLGESGNEAPGGGNIFTEIGGDLDFSKIETAPEKPKQDSIIQYFHWSDIAMKISVVVVLLLTADSFLRTQENATYLSSLPIMCSYLAIGVDGHDNTACKTPQELREDFSKEKQTLEESLVENLTLYIPKKLQTISIANSPEVQFIQERTGESRISIAQVLNQFNDIRKNTIYKGDDIECGNIVINEKGELQTSCNVYGGSILGANTSSSHSSRITAIKFLDSLSEKNSQFRFMEYPKHLEINKYSSSEIGLKSAFSTVTPIVLKLKYVPLNKL